MCPTRVRRTERPRVRVLLTAPSAALDRCRCSSTCRHTTWRSIGSLTASGSCRSGRGRRSSTTGELPCPSASTSLEATRSELARQPGRTRGSRAGARRPDRRHRRPVAVRRSRLVSGPGGDGERDPSLDHQRRAYEDREIEIMEQLEPVEAELAASGSEPGSPSPPSGRRPHRSLAWSGILDRCGADGELPPSGRRSRRVCRTRPGGRLRALRPKLGGIGAAKLVDGACGGCHLRLPACERDQVAACPARHHVLLRPVRAHPGAVTRTSVVSC